MKIPHITGSICMKSDLEIEELGEIISKHLFGGLKFGGKELEIYDEVPAITIMDDILGVRIILDGYSGFEENTNFFLSILPSNFDIENNGSSIDVSNYIYTLLEYYFKDKDDIKLIKNTMNSN